MRDFKYKTSFSSTVRCLIDEERDEFLAKASLDNLKSLIPDQYKDQIDLLPISFNSCTPNLGNKNGDMIDSSIALNIYKGFIGRPVNIEHKRSNGAMGHIVSAGFSQFNINYALGSGSEIIEASDIKDKKDPFNLSLAAVLYRLYNPDIIDLVEESNDPDSKEYLTISASWELLFDDFVIAVGSKYLKNCTIIEDKAKIEQASKYLAAMGGSGKLPTGEPIYRLLRGEVWAAGIGLTQSPAGDVMGLYVESQASNNQQDKEDNNMKNSEEIINKLTEIDKNFKLVSTELVSLLAKKCKAGTCHDCGEETDDEMDDETEHTCAKCGKKSVGKMWKNGKDKEDKEEAKAKNLEIPKDSISQIDTEVVNTPDNNKFMKITAFKDITDENLKECKASDIQSLYDTEVLRIAKEYSDKQAKEQETAKAATDKVSELENKVKEIEPKLTEVTEAYNKLVQENLEKDKLQKFSARMSTIADKYELTEKQSQIIAEEVKLLGKDEEFSQYIENKDLFLAKKGQKEAAASVNPQKALDDAASNANKSKEVIPNATDNTEVSAKDKYANAFGVDGWESSALKKK